MPPKMNYFFCHICFYNREYPNKTHNVVKVIDLGNWVMFFLFTLPVDSDLIEY